MSESVLAVDAENWRPAKGYESIALISRDGLVRTVDRVVRRTDGFDYPVRGRVCIVNFSSGVPSITLCRREVRLDRLIAETWLGPMSRNDRVIHLDGDAGNFAVHNLKIVPVREARQYYETPGRKRRAQEVSLQLRGEIWRAIPKATLYDISNYGRTRSRMMQPSVILMNQTSKRGITVVGIKRDGRRTLLSLAKLMRQVWPELAHEWADGRTQEAKESKRKSGNVSDG